MKKILIVDDSLAEVKLMQSVLQQAGYWPVALQDPRKIEATVAAERPSLILLDLNMPGLTGPEVEQLYADGQKWLAGEPLTPFALGVTVTR